MSDAKGLRGYIGSRPYFGQRTAQHVQNLVIRDYCQRKRQTYLLSATEYAMPGCFLVLEETVRELPAVAGIAFFSLFMLPPDADARRRLYDRVLGQGGGLHFAVEDMSIITPDDVQAIEDIWAVHVLTWKGSTP